MKLLLIATFSPEKQVQVYKAIIQIMKQVKSPEEIRVVMENGRLEFFYDTTDQRKNSPVNLTGLMAALENISEMSYWLGQEESIKLGIKNFAEKFIRVPLTPEIAKHLLGVGAETDVYQTPALADQEEKKGPTEKKKYKKRTGWGGGPTKKERVWSCFESLPDDHPGLGAKEIVLKTGIPRAQVMNNLILLMEECKIYRPKRATYKKVATGASEEAPSEIVAVVGDNVAPEVADMPREETKVATGASEEAFGEIVAAVGDNVATAVADMPGEENQVIPVAEKEMRLKFPRSIKELPGFARIFSLVKLGDPCINNVRIILDILYQNLGDPEDIVKADLEAAMAAAATIPGEKISWDAISLKLSEYENSTTEESREKAESYIKQGFKAAGYDIEYLKFLRLVSEKVFGSKYHGTKLYLQKKTTDLRIKLACVPFEDEQFEAILGRIASNKVAATFGIEELLTYMGIESEKDPDVRHDIKAVFLVVAKDIGRKVNQDIIEVRGDYMLGGKKAIAYTNEFLNEFMKRISNGQCQKMPCMQFLKQLQEVVRKRV